MPVLRNVRHERFCREYLKGAAIGLSQGEVYATVFGTSGHAAAASASRLLQRDDVKARLSELSRPAARRAKTTIDSLIDQFDQVFDGAMSDRQFGAAGSAATIKAKLTGFLRDKLEVGRVGEFDNCSTRAELLDAFLVDTSPAELLRTLDELRSEVEARAADQAVTVVEIEAPRDQVDRLALPAWRKPGRR
jgi:hypothetical protein